MWSQNNNAEWKRSFNCPKALQMNNKFMGYVDLVDFDNKIGGGFSAKGNFK